MVMNGLKKRKNLINIDIYRESLIGYVLNCKFIQIKYNDSWDTIKNLIKGAL